MKYYTIYTASQLSRWPERTIKRMIAAKTITAHYNVKLNDWFLTIPEVLKLQRMKNHGSGIISRASYPPPKG